MNRQLGATMRAADCAAVLFDLDGVLTDTAAVHEQAWKAMFTEVFDGLIRDGCAVAPYTIGDYFLYIDGKPRSEGVQAILASRGLRLPLGEAGDDPAMMTVCGLGNRKNDVFNAVLARDGIAPYPGSVRLLDALAERGTAVAVVSSSKNARTVLAAAHLTDRFEVVVDGVVAAELGLPGKPRPDTFLHAAERLGALAARAVVVEDAVSGVAAGRAGDFGLVVGVDRGAGERTLLDAGADVVVADLGDLL